MIKRFNRTSKIASICHFLMLAAISLLICFPLIWALSTSLKPKSELSVTGKVPGITEEQFKALAEEARAGCLVTKLYNCETTVEATLQS